MTGESGTDLMLFASTGKERRFAYITFPSGNKKIEYYGEAPINSPTNMERWFIGKFEYSVDECMIRARTIAVQKKWDDRATLFT